MTPLSALLCVCVCDGFLKQAHTHTHQGGSFGSLNGFIWLVKDLELLISRRGCCCCFNTYWLLIAAKKRIWEETDWITPVLLLNSQDGPRTEYAVFILDKIEASFDVTGAAQGRRNGQDTHKLLYFALASGPFPSVITSAKGTTGPDWFWCCERLVKERNDSNFLPCHLQILSLALTDLSGKGVWFFEYAIGSQRVQTKKQKMANVSSFRLYSRPPFSVSPVIDGL